MNTLLKLRGSPNRLDRTPKFCEEPVAGYSLRSDHHAARSTALQPPTGARSNAHASPPHHCALDANSLRHRRPISPTICVRPDLAALAPWRTQTSSRGSCTIALAAAPTMLRQHRAKARAVRCRIRCHEECKGRTPFPCTRPMPLRQFTPCNAGAIHRGHLQRGWPCPSGATHSDIASRARLCRNVIKVEDAEPTFQVARMSPATSSGAWRIDAHTSLNGAHTDRVCNPPHSKADD
jgi:hypothetical protein